MNSAVVRSKYKKSELDQAIKQYKEQVLPAIATHPGARSGMMLINRETGDGMSVAMYENEAAAKAFAPKAEKLIGSFKKYQTEDSTPKRELFEIATSTLLESKSVVEQIIKAFNAHDLEAVARLSAPDIEITAPGDMKFKGTQQAKQFDQMWINAFPDARVEAKQIITQGNHVVVQGVFSGTHNGTLKTPMGDVPPTGRKVKGDYTEVYEIDRGLVKKFDLLFDQVQLMTQLGMAPAPQAVKAGH